MKKTDCDDCMKLLASFDDIPTTIERTRAVWATQECNGAHTLDAWVANPNGRILSQDAPKANEAMVTHYADEDRNLQPLCGQGREGDLMTFFIDPTTCPDCRSVFDAPPVLSQDPEAAQNDSNILQAEG